MKTVLHIPRSVKEKDSNHNHDHGFWRGREGTKSREFSTNTQTNTNETRQLARVSRGGGGVIFVASSWPPFVPQHKADLEEGDFRRSGEQS